MQATQSKYVSKFDIPHPGQGILMLAESNWKYTVDGEPMIWSNHKQLPALGSKVKITMNGIGTATVVGYFYEAVQDGAWIGIMTLPTNPPKWLKDQNKAGASNMARPVWWRAGIGCTYGSECEV
jgi:hypothetical protein